MIDGPLVNCHICDLACPSMISRDSFRTDRRGFFIGGAAGLATFATPLSAASFGTGFTHNVASGEPGPDRVLLWTRYVGTGAAEKLRYEVAKDIAFNAVASGGEALAGPERDWCAKAVATGLQAGRWYYYRFIAPDGAISSIGRTRTLPDGAVDSFRIALFSCSNYGFGLFNAYGHAAEQGDFDLAIHVGDYIYEYPQGAYPAADKVLAGRILSPPNEIVTLADYRLRYATYRRDPDLQRLHQLYPMISGWDDHESSNDSWRDGAQNHQPDSEGEWGLRKTAAIRAYREWLPVSDEEYWTRYDIGSLATLFKLETRLTARDRQLELPKLAGEADAGEVDRAFAAFREGTWADPARTVLGQTQEQWLASGLRDSARSGRRWQVLAQQVIMGALAMPTDLAGGLADSMPEAAKARFKAGLAASRNNLPGSMDGWDGYPAARSRLLSAAREAQANLVVLSGDSHNGWAFDLDQGGKPAGVEFAGQSVTSPGAESWASYAAPDVLAKAMIARNTQLKWVDTSRRGYVALELTPARVTGEWRFMDTIRQRSTLLSGTHRMTALAGVNRFSEG